MCLLCRATQVGKEERGKYANPEALDNLNGRHCGGILHEHPGKGKDYSGDPGKATTDLGNKEKDKEVLAATATVPLPGLDYSKSPKDKLIAYVAALHAAVDAGSL